MRIIICDDQAIVRDGLKMMLGREVDIDVVATAQDGAEAVDLVTKHSPDLVLMDLKMPIMNGIEATRRIRQQHPDIPVLVLTTYDADEWVFDALRAGAVGYLLKDTPREQLVAAVRGSADGKSFVDPAVAGKLITQVNGATTTAPSSTVAAKLTPRETEVLRLLAQGQTNQEIAKTLFLSEGTIRNYVSQIFAKLEVTDRTQAAVFAWRYGLVQR